VGATWRLAWRNVGRNRRRTAIVMAAGVVGVGGAALTVACLSGLLAAMVETAVATDLGHLQVTAPRGRLAGGETIAATRIAPLPGIRAWAPRLATPALLAAPRGSAGVRLVGVDPARETTVSAIAGSLVAGAYLAAGTRQALLGAALAERLRVGVGDKVVLEVEAGAGETAGEAFRVAGLFRSALGDGFDAATVFVDLGAARRLLGAPDAVSEVVILARDPRDLAGLRRAVAAAAGDGVRVRTWEELRPTLVAMIAVLRLDATILYAIVFVSMGFGIGNVLLVSVHERVPELGVLLSLGMRPRRVLALVVTESLLLTALGAAGGLALGLAAVALARDGVDLSAFA
jgi:ABC-type lipoprotein release transport system permease subunit